MMQNEELKDTAKGSVNSSNQSGGITVGNIQAENVAGGNIENITKTITQDSSIKDIIALLEVMKIKIEDIEITDESREKVKGHIDNAIVKAKSTKPDKKSIGESLENASKVLEGTSSVVLKATSFGHMFSKALIWAGQSVGWL